MQCDDFANISPIPGRPLPVPFPNNGFTYINADIAMPAKIEDTMPADGKTEIRMGNGGIVILLPSESSTVTFDVWLGAGPLHAYGYAGDGTQIGHAWVSGAGPLQIVLINGLGLKFASVHLAGGDNEASLMKICIE
jgi:hypothetical protein